MWEYKIVELPNPGQAHKMDDLPGLRKDAERLLNELGAEGWEMMEPWSYTAFLKRQIGTHPFDGRGITPDEMPVDLRYKGEKFEITALTDEDVQNLQKGE